MIVWKPSYETGIPAVDAHHRVLIRTFNELEEALASGISRERLREVLLFLQHYADWHFEVEERYAEAVACPVARTNREAHAWFRKKIQDTYATFRQTPDEELQDFARSVHALLSAWLLQHVLRVDHHIGRCYARRKSKGVDP